MIDEKAFKHIKKDPQNAVISALRGVITAGSGGRTRMQLAYFLAESVSVPNYIPIQKWLNIIMYKCTLIN